MQLILSQPLVQSIGDLFGSARRLWKNGISCSSPVAFAIAVSFLWAAVYNVRFWQDAAQAMWHQSVGSALFLSSLFVVVVCLQALLLLLLPSRRLMVGAASILFVVAAVSSYFSSHYGVVMNQDMLRNVFQTDAAESRDLLDANLLVRCVVLGIVPAVLVWKARWPKVTIARSVRQRALAIGVAIVISAIALLSSSASFAVFFREHKPVRYEIAPAAPVTSAMGLLFGQRSGSSGPVANASGAAQRAEPPRTKPLLVLMVVGETARAQNFQLGGYPRRTNPELAETEGVVYFPNATSCGTATAISVPCMFSHLPRAEFDVAAASRYENVLDAVQRAGLAVEWRDNNAGCKGVCARVPFKHYGTEHDELCRDGVCQDGILAKDVASTLGTMERDTLIVMHQMGSHGPAYSARYPRDFGPFKPACASNQLQHCSHDEVVNAYDNTIAYTDHVLAAMIRSLREASDHVDSVLIYVSDHGESLGEQGMYLHGLPYRFAPDTQKRVPMLIWMSHSYAARTQTSLDCMQTRAFGDEVSHDNLYHTLLGAAEVRNASYDARLDLFAACRQRKLPAEHE